jgi:hypothetical protein
VPGAFPSVACHRKTGIYQSTFGARHFYGSSRRGCPKKCFPLGSAQEELRAIVRRTLRRYGYPPDKQEKATDGRIFWRRSGKTRWSHGADKNRSFL